MKKFRITKYNPQLRDMQGRYCHNEWTSVSDIGKVYAGKLFTNVDYLRIEESYLQAILGVLQDLKITKMRITGVELYTTLPSQTEVLNKNALKYDEEKDIIKRLTDSKIFALEDLELYFRLQLREYFWGEWVDVHNRAIVEFGYDYYMYITCKQILSERIEQIQKMGLYVEVATNTCDGFLHYLPYGT